MVDRDCQLHGLWESPWRHTPGCVYKGGLGKVWPRWEDTHPPPPPPPSPSVVVPGTQMQCDSCDLCCPAEMNCAVLGHSWPFLPLGCVGICHSDEKGDQSSDISFWNVFNTGLQSVSSLGTEPEICFGESLNQCSSTFLMLWPLNPVPHAVLIPQS